MSTISELQKLMEQEDHVEFKEAKRNFPFAGGSHDDIRERRKCVLGYIVALANEKGGRLVLGMTDKYPHLVVGSNFAEGKIGQLEDEIYNRLAIRVHIEELFDNKLRVVVFHIPSRPIGKALRFEGVPLMRTGDSLREMDDSEYFSIINEQDPDFSARPCAGLTIDDLDGAAVSSMRRLIADKRLNEDVLTIPLPQLLAELRLSDSDGKLTYAALILLGSPKAIEKHLPQSNVVVEFRNSHADERYSARREFRLPLFTMIDNVWDYLNQPLANPLLHVEDMPTIHDVPAYNRTTIREALLNACVHRSYQLTGDVVIRQYPDVMEVVNPGGFPFGVNIGNILTVPSSPRNRLLAETMEKTGWIERSGQGANIMFANCVKEGKPLPDYSNSDDYFVCVRLKATISSPKLYLFLRKWGQRLNSYELINLYHIYNGDVDSLFPNSIDTLVEKGAIQEDEHFLYTMGVAFFEQAYTNWSKKYGAETIRRVYYSTKSALGASSTNIAKALNPLLTLKQSRSLIANLCKDGCLSMRGNGRATKYTWVE